MTQFDPEMHPCSRVWSSFAETGTLAPVLWGMDDKEERGLSDNVGHFAKMGMKKTTPGWQEEGIGDSL